MASHYETLGVSNSATSDEIKRAYRKLAMQWHPDRNANDPTAAERFKEISSAYEVLSDDGKRAEYDAMLSNPHGFQGGHTWHGNFSGNMEDILAQVFGQHGFTPFRRGPVRNRDVSLTLNLTLEEAFSGKQTPLQISTPSGRLVDLMVNIPAGIDNGVRIRYQGQGDHSNTSLPPGDLYINVSVADHPLFRRTGSTIETRVSIDALSAIIGSRTKINCIDGQMIELVIPPGTQPGTRMRLARKGMPLSPGSTDRGDMMVLVDIKIPSDLPDEIRSDLAEIQRKRGLDTP